MGEDVTCQWCGSARAYAYHLRPHVFKCADCNRQFSETSAQGHPWRASKLPPDRRALIEAAFRRGDSANSCAVRDGFQPKTVYQAYRRLKAAHIASEEARL